MIVAGADGCRTGWVVCLRDGDGALDMRVVTILAEVCQGLAILAVYMPIGLDDIPWPAGACERDARALLLGKTSSVFPTPCRPALDCSTHAEANDLSKTLGVGLPRQTFHLFPKMREVDALFRGSETLRSIVYEAHPELAFARMNDGRPLLSRKRRPEGFGDGLRALVVAIGVVLLLGDEGSDGSA
ncbi:MAG: DUF429 domain-containing protein [Reyranella sp.]